MSPAPLDPVRLRRASEAAGLAVPGVLRDEVASTQDVVRAWAAEGRPSGAWLVAERQTGGRGRRGRRWHTGAGEGLALSILLRPVIPASRLGWISLAAAVGVRRATGDRLQIKWPNDLLAPDGRKVAGLLAEAEIVGRRVRHVVLGIGLNVTGAPEGVGAASLADLAPVDTSREALAGRVVAAVLAEVGRLPRDTDGVAAAWWAGCAHAERVVRVGDVTGRAVGLAEDGGLTLRLGSGATRVVAAGDVEMVSVEER